MGDVFREWPGRWNEITSIVKKAGVSGCRLALDSWLPLSLASPTELSLSVPPSGPQGSGQQASLPGFGCSKSTGLTVQAVG